MHIVQLHCALLNPLNEGRQASKKVYFLTNVDTLGKILLQHGEQEVLSERRNSLLRIEWKQHWVNFDLFQVDLTFP